MLGKAISSGLQWPRIHRGTLSSSSRGMLWHRAAGAPCLEPLGEQQDQGQGRQHVPGLGSTRGWLPSRALLRGRLLLAESNSPSCDRPRRPGEQLWAVSEAFGDSKLSGPLCTAQKQRGWSQELPGINPAPAPCLACQEERSWPTPSPREATWAPPGWPAENHHGAQRRAEAADGSGSPAAG